MPYRAASPTSTCTDARRVLLAAWLLLVMLAPWPAPAQEPTLSVLGVSGPVPADWQPERPASGMRLAQAAVPPDGHFIIYYFGQGQGGTPALNIARQSQFTAADGGPVEPEVRTFEASGMPVTLVELRGNYARGVGMSNDTPVLVDHVLRAGIVETPHGNLYIHLYGPSATVDDARSGFDRFLNELHPAS